MEWQCGNSIRKESKLLLADAAMCYMQRAVVFDDVESKKKQVLSCLAMLTKLRVLRNDKRSYINHKPLYRTGLRSARISQFMLFRFSKSFTKLHKETGVK